ncbi:MAG: hypothetical protein EBX52_12355, partial [Proteobacteria bacterium]|nr:hypothetical protein [Pseudomonadota bacterium]
MTPQTTRIYRWLSFCLSAIGLSFFASSTDSLFAQNQRNCVSRAQTDALYENSYVSCLLQNAGKEVEDRNWGKERSKLRSEIGHIDALKKIPANARFARSLDREKERITNFITLKDKLRSKECSGDEEAKQELLREAARTGFMKPCDREASPFPYLNPILQSSAVTDETKKKAEKIDMMVEIADLAYEDAMKGSLETAMTLLKKYNPDCAKKARPDTPGESLARSCELTDEAVMSKALNLVCPDDRCGIRETLSEHAKILLGTNMAAKNGGHRNAAFGRIKGLSFQDPNTTVENLRSSVLAMNKPLMNAPGAFDAKKFKNEPGIFDPYKRATEIHRLVQQAKKGQEDQIKINQKEAQKIRDFINHPDSGDSKAKPGKNPKKEMVKKDAPPKSS